MSHLDHHGNSNVLYSQHRFYESQKGRYRGGTGVALGMALQCLWGTHPGAWGLRGPVSCAGARCPSPGAPIGPVLQQVLCARGWSSAVGMGWWAPVPAAALAFQNIVAGA